jgi:hypothetical protein
MCVFHIFARGPYGMVFEHLQDVFDPKDFVNGFLQLHQLAMWPWVASQGPLLVSLVLLGFWFCPSFWVISN